MTRHPRGSDVPATRLKARAVDAPPMPPRKEKRTIRKPDEASEGGRRTAQRLQKTFE